MSKSVLAAALRNSAVAALPSVKAETETEDAVKWLRGIVKVEFSRKTEIMMVSCTTRDPHDAAVLTNAVVDTYMATISDADRELQRRFGDVDLRIGTVETELKGKLKALDRIKTASPADKTKPSSTHGSSDAAVLQAEIESLKRALQDLREECDRIGIEIKRRVRITVVERAQEPKSPD